MTSGSSQKCPFVAGPAIEDSRFFVGRKDELNTIKSRMTGAQPTSVNVVGRHKIGKSSLLLHFYEQSKSFEPRYVVIYLCLQDAQCQLESTLYAAIANELQNHPAVNPKPSFLNLFKAKPSFLKLLQVKAWDRDTFSTVIKEFKKHNLLPVLCLDKFDAMFQNPEEFDNGFYENLHSLINHNALMLVVATLENLQVYREEKKLTSSFFNVGHVLLLKEFSKEEAQELVRLPESKGSGNQAALLPQYQELAKQWGKRDPFRLQLAGRCLWEAQQETKDVDWAKKEFERQLESQPQTKPDWRRVSPVLVWILWKFPKRCGHLVKTPGVVVSEITTVGTGITMLLLIVLVLVGRIPGSKVEHQFRMFVCSGLSSALPAKFCK